MAKSIVQVERECYFCKTTLNLEEHHIFYGIANRKNAEKHGLKVFLCKNHHTGANGVHFNKDIDIQLKQTAQRKFEKNKTRAEFMEVFGRNYL